MHQRSFFRQQGFGQAVIVRFFNDDVGGQQLIQQRDFFTRVTAMISSDRRPTLRVWTGVE